MVCFRESFEVHIFQVYSFLECTFISAISETRSAFKEDRFVATMEPSSQRYANTPFYLHMQIPPGPNSSSCSSTNISTFSPPTFSSFSPLFIRHEVIVRLKLVFICYTLLVKLCIQNSAIKKSFDDIFMQKIFVAQNLGYSKVFLLTI